MLPTGAEDLLTHASKSQVIYMEKMLQKLETLVEGSEVISNPSLRPLSDLAKFLSSLISYMSYMDL